MGAFQTAVIHAALRELFAIFASGKPDAEVACVTFEVPGQPRVWIQAMHHSINAAYPHQERPLSFLSGARLPSLPEFGVEAWEAGRYVTFSHRSSSVDHLAGFIDSLFVALHGLPSDTYQVAMSFDEVD